MKLKSRDPTLLPQRGVVPTAKESSSFLGPPCAFIIAHFYAPSQEAFPPTLMTRSKPGAARSCFNTTLVQWSSGPAGGGQLGGRSNGQKEQERVD